MCEYGYLPQTNWLGLRWSTLEFEIQFEIQTNNTKIRYENVYNKKPVRVPGGKSKVTVALFEQTSLWPHRSDVEGSSCRAAKIF